MFYSKRIHGKRLLLTAQNNKRDVRVKVSNRIFRIKYLCCHVKDNHSRNLQAANCAKECQLNQAKRQKIKDKSYVLSKKPTVKARSIATFLFTNLESRPNSAHGQILSNCHYTERGAFN